MISKKSKIGVLDSGVGALTVAREIQKQLPKEDIIYFGDNGNVPYGNKTEEEIYILTKRMIDYLIEQDVKLIAIACNTISTLVDKYFSDYDIPILSIIEPAAHYVANNNIEEVGILATNFTIKMEEYNKKIWEKNKNVKIISEGSKNLAEMVDNRDKYKLEDIQSTLDMHLLNLKNNSEDMTHLILGCTHYPILVDMGLFENMDMDVELIDPAEEQVKLIKRILEEKDLLNDEGGNSFNLYTTGKKEIYDDMISFLGMKKPDDIIVLDK